MAGFIDPAPEELLPCLCESRKDDLELGRSGVVGLEGGRGRDEDRWVLPSIISKSSTVEYDAPGVVGRMRR